jgi:hypothetical protein
MNIVKEKEKEIIDIKDEKEVEKPENANKYLLSFLLENSDQDEDYFKDSEDDSNEEQINSKTNDIKNNNNINSINRINNNLTFGKNNSNSNLNENSTKDNSNNYFNISQNNNYFFNTSPQFNPNKNSYFKNNNLMNNNNQNSFPNQSMNNNNNFSGLNNNSYISNNMNSNNNFSFNSFNNNMPIGNMISFAPSWNSFNGLSPINSLNFSNNNLIPPLSFNNDNINSNIKSLSFNKANNKKYNNSLSGCKIMKYKHSKSLKFSLEDENLNIPSNQFLKKLFDMSEQSLYNYIITQKGSRDIQAIIEKLSEKEIEILIYKLKNCISDITLDKYGNYFTQKLIQICLPFQRIKILEYMKNRFVEIANNTYGTHPLQSLIEIICLPQEKKLILSYILGNESILALDTKGTHILQKFISSTKDEERLELNNNIINLIDKLIIDASGVCVLIVLVKHTNDKSIRKKLANYITKEGPLNFIQHPYANYAVQCLIKSSDLSYCDIIIETIVQNYLSLSLQKFSSNVVENCISYGIESTIQKIYKSIIEDDKLESLLNDTYGNYVLEKLIEKLKIEEKLVLIKKIEKFGKNKNISKNIMNLLYK